MGDWSWLDACIREQTPRSEEFPGLFVAAEGIDGAGKSTVMQAVGETLKKRGFPYTLVNSLNYSLDDPILAECADWAGRIVFRSTHRAANKHDRFVPMADALRYVLAFDNVIRPRLMNGELILSDSWCVKRMIKNLLALQAYATADAIREQKRWIFDLFAPAMKADICFRFKIKPAVAYRQKKGDVSDWELGRRVPATSREAEFVGYQQKIDEALDICADAWQWRQIQLPHPEDLPELLCDEIVSTFKARF